MNEMASAAWPRGAEVRAHSVHLSSLKTPSRRAAFSMVELMIAVIILGIGLLITSSMFPIAWFKARDVAEATLVPALADTAHLHAKSLTRPTGPLMDRNNDGAIGLEDAVPSSFFPGDWFGLYPPVSYPDTRVHPLNGGNYRADTFAEYDANDQPITDRSWGLNDNMGLFWDDSSSQVFWPQLSGSVRTLPAPQYRAVDRMYPTLPARPDPATATPAAQQLWSERFELRRYCWSVLYRFNEMPGPSLSDVTDPPTPAGQWANRTQAALRRPRRLTMYYVTLKRPVNARYAQQVGYNPNASGSQEVDPVDPRALPSSEDLLLPVPWRIAAELIIPNVPAPGVASEITVSAGSLQADILAEGAVLIDDRTGQVFRVAQRRDGGTTATLTLDKTYDYLDIVYAPDYDPEAADPAANWATDRRWYDRGSGKNCDDWAREAVANGISLPMQCDSEDEPELRYYWVFPPPVDAVRGSGNRPLFNGSPPVVDVITREVTIAP